MEKNLIPRINSTWRPGRQVEFILIGFVVFIIPQMAGAAVLSARLPSGPQSAGQTISVPFEIDTDGESINAVEGRIDFSKEVSLEAISSGDNIINFLIISPPLY